MSDENQDAATPSRASVSGLSSKFFYWILGIAGAAAAAFFSGILNGGLQSSSESFSAKLAEGLCEMRTSMPSGAESEFIVLISPFAGDASGEVTARVVNSFHGAEFKALRTCEHVGFDVGKDTGAAEKDVVARSKAILKKYRADLLIFGDVVHQNDAVEMWIVDEDGGGCDAHPVKMKFQDGFAPESAGVGETLRRQIVAESVKQMAAACNHDANLDWKGVERRTKKVKDYLARQNSLSPTELSEIKETYSDAMFQIYQNTRNEEWFKAALEFDLGEARKMPAPEAKVAARWYFAASYLMRTKWMISGKGGDLKTAMDYIDESISLSPAFYNVSQRGYLHQSDKNFMAAAVDFESAAKMEPKNSGIYVDLAATLNAAGERDRALDAYNTAIKLDPSNAGAFSARCYYWILAPDLDRALADCNEAIRQDPSLSKAYATRRFIWMKKGDQKQAIADATAYITIEPSEGYGYLKRAESWVALGSFDKAIQDLQQAAKRGARVPQTMFEIATVEFDIGMYEAAAADFKIAGPHRDSEKSKVWESLAKAKFLKAPKADVASASHDGETKITGTAFFVKLFAGEASNEQLQSELTKAATLDKDAKCSADFFGGEYLAIAGKTQQAKKLLASALSECDRLSYEFSSATAEGYRLGH